jgi:hypothetical protein
MVSSLSGCLIFVGDEGSVSGSYSWTGDILNTVNWSNSGFPSDAAANIYYDVKPGSYSFYYNIIQGGVYYPYGSSVLWEYVSYDVTADQGSLFGPGEDKLFEIYLSLHGDTVMGLNVQGMGDPTVKADGTKVYSNGAYTITMTSKRVDQLPVGAVIETHIK